jgi:hypothetical protein
VGMVAEEYGLHLRSQGQHQVRTAIVERPSS